MSTADNRHKLRTAITFHQAGRLQSAAKIYGQILESEPDNFQALHCFGLVEASAGHLQRAKSLIGRALRFSRWMFKSWKTTRLYCSNCRSMTTHCKVPV